MATHENVSNLILEHLKRFQTSFTRIEQYPTRTYAKAWTYRKQLKPTTKPA